jgi:tetratricopeptide (TPR) repeat protein
VAELSALKYRVFLSYSDRDKPWARWLQAALENYPIDRVLVGRETPAGPVPQTLRPIVRDCETAAADRPLSERALAALRASGALVVLCSPQAAASRRVNELVRRFIALGRADRIIPVIIDGEPGNPARECFPPALRFMLGPDRPLTDRRGEPAFADARLDRDGKRRAEHKVAAAVLCLGLDEVERRTRRILRRRSRVRCSGIVAALLAATLLGDAALVWTRSRLAHDEPRLDRTLAHAATLASGVVEASKRLGLPRGVSVRLLGQAEDIYRGVAGFGGDPVRLRQRTAAALIDFARLYAALDSPELTGARTAEAERLLQEMAAEADAAARRRLPALYDRLGDMLRGQGRDRDALASYRAGLAVAERLASDPGNTDRQHDLVLRHLKVGDAHLDMGALGPALTSYQAALVVAEYLAAVDSGRARWQHDLMLAHGKIGDALRLQGDLAAALASYQESRAVAERLVAGDPAGVEWRRGLAVALIKIGDVEALQGRSDEALAHYREGNAIVARLAAAGEEARQEDLLRDLGISHERIGVALEARGDLAAADSEYRATLAIARRIAEASDDVSRQRDLGIAHRHLGDVARARGEIDEALRHYRASHAVIARIAAADPGHSGRQYDLGASHARIGVVLEAKGDLAGALAEYATCLGIAGRLAAAAPDDAAAQRDLAESYRKLAAVHHRLGRSGQALAELRHGRDIIAALRPASAEAEQWSDDLAQFEDRIAALEGRGGPANKPAAPAVASVSLAPAVRDGPGAPSGLGQSPKL